MYIYISVYLKKNYIVPQIRRSVESNWFLKVEPLEVPKVWGELGLLRCFPFVLFPSGSFAAGLWRVVHAQESGASKAKELRCCLGSQKQNHGHSHTYVYIYVYLQLW